MLKNKKRVILTAGAVSILAIALGVGAFALTGVASAQTEPAQNGFGMGIFNPGPDEAGMEAPLQHGPGLPGDGRIPGKEADNTYLAEALGISVEELQAAIEAAWQNGIDQALEQGLLTEAQAEWMKEGRAGRGGRGGWLVPWLRENEALDMESLLAEQLGITIEELQEARESAADAALQDAIDSGKITQEQADLIEARRALRGYIDRGALEAEALGMTQEELQAAREQGKYIPELLEEQGLTQEQFQEAMQAAYERMVNQAVADGVITQAQAELLLSAQPGHGFGMPPLRPEGGPGGRHP